MLPADWSVRAANMSLQITPIRSSLNRQLGIAGGERILVLGALFVSAYFGFVVSMGHGVWYGVVVGGVLWTITMYVLTRMGAEDMQLSSVFWRHLKYRPFYSAHGRLDSETWPMKYFVK